MNCPNCQSRMMTQDTRSPETGIVRRRRHCSECNDRFYTIELPEEEWKALLRNSRDLVKLRDFLASARKK